MRTGTVMAAALMAVAFSVSLALATKHTPEERGKAHFNNPAFAGGKKSCNACHPGGAGLEKSGAKTKFNIMGGNQESLEEAVNVCIVNANKGNAIAADSAEMQEMVSYIKSLGKE